MYIKILPFISGLLFSYAAAQEETTASIDAPSLLYAAYLAKEWCPGADTLCVDRTPPSEWRKAAFFADIVTRTLMRGTATWSGEHLADELLNDDFELKHFYKKTLGIVGACLVGVAIVVLLIGVFMLPNCCCKCSRNCWGWFCCKRWCSDRDRQKPIQQITKKYQKRTYRWAVFCFTMFVLTSLVAIGFGLKSRWSGKYALCQLGRLGREISSGYVFYDGKAPHWLPVKSSNGYSYELPPAHCEDDIEDGARRVMRRIFETKRVSDDTFMAPIQRKLVANELQPRSTSRPVFRQLQEGHDPTPESVRRSFMRGLRDVMADVLKSIEENQDEIDDTIKWTWIPAVALPALVMLFGGIWGIAITDRLKKHYKRGTEPNLGSYMRQFAFLWGWFCLSGSFLIIVGIIILMGVSGATTVCQVVRDIAKDPSVAQNYRIFEPLYPIKHPEDEVTWMMDACVANRNNKNWEDFVAVQGEAVKPVLQWCRAQAISLGAATEGVCGGVTQDFFWIGFMWCLMGLMSWFLWITSYRMFHYFKQRVNDAKGASKAPGIDKSPSTLMAEAKCGNADTVDRICKDLDPKEVVEERYQNTTLHFAAYSGDTRTVNRLLDQKLDPDERNRYGYTPLGVAAAEGHANVVRILVDRGANPTLQDEFGETPLHAAARAGNLAVVEALCSEKAPEPTYLNDEEEAAVDTAARSERLEVEQFLDMKTPKGFRKTPPRFDLSPATQSAGLNSPATASPY